MLAAGVVLVQATGRGLVEERLEGIELQAAIVAGTLAHYATDPETHTLRVSEAEPLLRQLIAPTRLRGRLYLPDGTLAIDTRNLLPRNVVQEEALPALDSWARLKEWLQRFYDGVMGVRPFANLERYSEGGRQASAYHEVESALTGETASVKRVDDQNKLVLSVATPVQSRYRTIYGALLISTESHDIDDIVRQERTSLFEVLLLAFAVMMISSLYLASTIGEPVRKLAAAADRVRFGEFGTQSGGRGEIPNFPERTDEIGDLADSLRSMTTGLYNRIDAIERFAADVAHELKNPLTSLSSALEMLRRAPDDEARDRLLAIARGDIRRIDRLITDISDASRLDAELSRGMNELVTLSPFLATIVEVYRLTDSGVGFALNDALPMGAVVRGQGERLGQVFRNLIDNALSFSPKGGTVTISAAAHELVARVTVEDEGPGIPEENLESIFERFYTSRPVETFGKNSGLGLSIARQIAQSAGGRLWAENRPSPDGAAGKSGGARLVVELPLVRS